MKLTVTACIEATKEKTWEYLSDVSNINLWVDDIITSPCESNQTRGIGTVRICHLRGNKISREKFVAWEEGHSYTYQAVTTSMPMVKQAQNTWSVTSMNEKTLLTSEPEIVMKGGIFGKFLGLLMRPMIQKQMADVLASFKYLVENGQPYDGKPSRLSRAPITC